MSKLNKPGKNVVNDIRAVAAKREQELGVSANGNLQFKKEPLQMLYELTVSTLFGKGTFYKSGDQLVRELRKQVVTAVDMGAYDFVANLAVHARGEMNIRTIPIVLVVEFAKALSDKREAATASVKTKLNAEIAAGRDQRVRALRKQLTEATETYSYAHMRELVRDVIQRADQITDMYAYALDVFGGKGKIPMAIKRGVADAFNKFGEYNFAKYNRAGSVKFRDVLRIVHPEAKDARQGMIFEKIMKDTLEAPYTWEVELSRNGQLAKVEQKSKKQLWTELVMSGKMGYMALLRNLRNILEAGVDSAVLREYVCDVIADPKRVAESRQLPFDFVEAYNIVKDMDSKVATAVSKAIDLSVSNMPKLGEKVWFIVDFSGSMGGDPDDPNRGQYYGYQSGTNSAVTTATLLAAALLKANGDRADELAVTLFGSDAKTLRGIDTNNSVLAIKKELLRHRTGSIAGSTNFGAALNQKSSLGFEPDTIVVMTDGEVNGFPYSRLRNLTGKDTMKLTVNLNAASTTPMTKEDGWFTASGWSPAMFKWIPAMREKATVVDQLSVPYIGVPKKAKRFEEAVE